MQKKGFKTKIVISTLSAVLIIGSVITAKDYLKNQDTIVLANSTESTPSNLQNNSNNKKYEPISLSRLNKDTNNRISKKDEEKLIKNTTKALKKYFDVSFQPKGYDIDVTYYKAYKDIKASYSVNFYISKNQKLLNDPNNIGPDGFPKDKIKSKFKPEYFATYSEDMKLTGLYLSYMKWEKRSVPLSVEEAKKLAVEFLISNNMIVDGKPKFMGTTIISDFRTIVTFQNGTDGAIDVAVDIYAGKVEHFEYMSKERAEMILKPVEEGEGLG